MNEYQKNLYNKLLELTKTEPHIFYFVEHCIDDDKEELEEGDDGATLKYHTFCYRRIPNYNKWLINEAALECRGITFQVDTGRSEGVDVDVEAEPIRLVSMPFEKFFNLNENPLTIDLDISNPKEILLKEDGSLISSMYIPSSSCNGGGRLHLKSKSSFYSDKAKEANQLIRLPKWKPLYDWTLDWAERGHTVIMEYTSPTNTIVVPYSEPSLTVLAIRNHIDGSYVDLFDTTPLPPEIQKMVVKNLISDVPQDNAEAFIRSVKGQENIEGYVVRLQTGQRIKIKTEWYNTLHQLRGSYKSGTATKFQDVSDLGLIKAILDDIIDDVRVMHNHSPSILQRIEELTLVVSNFYNDTTTTTTNFFHTNQQLSRREYAILAKNQLTSFQMGLAMQLFSGQGKTQEDGINYSQAIFNHIKKINKGNLKGRNLKI